MHVTLIAIESAPLAPGTTSSVMQRPIERPPRRKRIRAQIQRLVKQSNDIQQRAAEASERVVRLFVALILMAIAGMVLLHTIDTLTDRGEPIEKAMKAVNYLLFAIIIVEVMITVRAQLASRFECNVRQLENYLMIAITSAVRDILAIGAQCLMTSGGGTGEVRSTVELAVNGAVIVGLTVALLLVHRGAETREPLVSDCT